MITNRFLGTLGLAVVLGGAMTAVSATATATDASADVRIRFGGRAHVRIGGPRVRVRAHYRPWRPYRPVHVGGHIWIGGYYYDRPFAQPPPPPAPSCDCGPDYYPPIAPAPAPGYVVAAVVEEPLPRWGFGAFLGGVSVDGEHEGEDLGLIGQFRLAGPLVLEGEIAKNTLAEGARVDRRYLLGLNLELGARKRLAPYVTAGLGTTQVEVEGGWQDNQAIAEIGAGLRWRMSDRITLFGDIRMGSRESVDTGEQAPNPADGTLSRAVLPDDDGESYSRMRLGGLVTF